MRQLIIGSKKIVKYRACTKCGRKGVYITKRKMKDHVEILGSRCRYCSTVRKFKKPKIQLTESEIRHCERILNRIAYESNKA